MSCGGAEKLAGRASPQRAPGADVGLKTMELEVSGELLTQARRPVP